MISAKLELLEANFESHLHNICYAIYLGGSRVDPVIDAAHDYDYICFPKPHCRHFLVNKLKKLGFKSRGSLNALTRKKDNSIDLTFDISQMRVPPYNKIDWFSYLDCLMTKFIGEEVCPKTDIIVEHRNAFLKDLKEKAKLISNGTITNQKRWYHILRGIYILKNGSYEVSDEQRKEINILHDLTPGWEKVRDKTIQLLNNLED